MPRTALLTFAASAALALAACADSGNPEADGSADADATAAAAATGDAAPATAPDTPVSNTATPGTRPGANTGTRPGASPSATATTAARATRAVDSNPPGDACGASQVAAFVALVATPSVRARLAAKVGHSQIRWIGPNTAVTDDYRPQRLNVTLDRADVITGGKCG